MKKFLKVLFVCVLLTVLSGGGLYYYQHNKAKAATIDQLADQTIQTNQISTNLNSDNLIQVKFSIELDSKDTKKQAEKIVPIIESDIIKILSQSNKGDLKNIAAFEEKVKNQLNERFSDGKNCPCLYNRITNTVRRVAMLRGIDTAASGMLAVQRRQEALTNNLANIETPGYKKVDTTLRAFPEVFLERINDSKTSSTGNAPGFSWVGSMQQGVYAQENISSFLQTRRSRDNE